MNTQTQKNKKELQREALQAFALELKKAGYNVLTSKTNPFKWLTFEKNGRFASVEADRFAGYNFATIHKPCREHGTGLSTAREADLTLANAENALHAIGWQHLTNAPSIIFYESIYKYINHPTNRWAGYYSCFGTPAAKTA